MDDLLAFRLLAQGSLEDPRLPALLDALATFPVHERIAHLGVLAPAIESESPEVRAAALGALTGADGPLAIRWAEDALDDEDEAVRLAAVEAMRAAAKSEPARWAHVVFHGRADVRRAAIDKPSPQGAIDLEFYLLADPLLQTELKRRLDAPRGDVTAPTLIVPGDAFPATLDFCSRGILSRSQTRRVLAVVAWARADRWLERSRRRSVDVLAAWRAAAETPEGPGDGLDAKEEDELDALFDLFWDEPAHPEEITFERLAKAVRSWDEVYQRRAFVALLAIAQRRRSLPPAIACLLVELNVHALGYEWIPRATRRLAVRALHERGADMDRLTDDAVRAMLGLELCRHPDGGADLYVMSGLLRLVTEKPLELLHTVVGEEPILDALARRLEESSPLLTQKDDSIHGRSYLLAKLRERMPDETDRVLAVMARTLPDDELDFLEALEVEPALRVLARLLDAGGGGPIAAKRSEKLADILVKTLGPPRFREFLDAWIREDGDLSPLGGHFLTALVKPMSSEDWVELVRPLPGDRRRALLAAIAFVPTFPFGKELALAHALVRSDDDVTREWAQARLPTADEAPPPRPAWDDSAPLPPDLAADIARAADSDLASALAPTFAGGFHGVAAALSRRSAPSLPSIPACLALLGSDDPMPDVDAQFHRFASEEQAFVEALDSAMQKTWGAATKLPPLGHALLHRWEKHAFAFEQAAEAAYGSLARALAAGARLSSATLRSEVLFAGARILAIHAYRDRPRLRELATPELLELLVAVLSGGGSEGAAEALLFLHRSGVVASELAALAPRVRLALPDLSDAARERIAPWLSSRGLPPAPLRPGRQAELDEDTVRRIRGTRDLEELSRLCHDERTRVVHEAALRLLDLGEEGQARLVELLASATVASSVRPIVESVTLWNEGASLARARSLSNDLSRSTELRHRIAISLLERGERDALPAALAALLDPADTPWLRPEDWTKLLALSPITPRELARALARSSQPHVYLPAVELLLSGIAREDLDSLVAFLDCGTDRMGALRRRAAEKLQQHGSFHGFPLVLHGQLETIEGSSELLVGAPPSLVIAVAEGALAAGKKVMKEPVVLHHLDQRGVDLAAREAAFELLLAFGTVDKVRGAIVSRIERSFGLGRARKLRRVAETFAWGVRIGRELTGKLFRVSMVPGKGLGYTRFTENRVFVTPLPILRRERNAEDVVEGLILHELGHHMFHKGTEQEKVWKRAEGERMHGLLNLVADEHLERNLRALDSSFGDRLKILAAYAFQHASREIRVKDLLAMLASSAFEVLTASRLKVAREPDSVSVDNGEVLLSMERAGLSFPRFVRALRMGLGNRHDDPRVDRGLELFKGGFRHSTMEDLYVIAEKLRAIFGWQVRMVEQFGPHESLEGGDADRTIHGEGISDDEIQGEVERVLNPRARQGASAAGKGPGRPWVNVNPDEAFKPITQIVHVPFDPAAHAPYAAQVRRPAAEMRRFFESLGLSMVPQRLRLAGKRFDRTRTLPMILRGDPRVLISRETRVNTDLFLGILVDCSGSMSSGQLIEKAKLFAVLLAEAARGMRNVDVRVLGFTDAKIFDAGDSQRCAAHALFTEGGNNDAAALWHLGSIAKQSRRRAKVLVMISDGLPTECSVAALRAVVERLTKKDRMCCAQVAVRPLSEQCFPHHVLLEGDDVQAAVRKFGVTIANLVRRTLAQG